MAIATADDPKRYRNEKEVEIWKPRDPLTRFKIYLEQKNLWTAAWQEKLELEPRLDVQDGVGVVEFVVRSVRAIFLLSPNEGNVWALHILEEDDEPELLSEIHGGTKAEQGSRRLAAARIVTTVGNWVQNAKGSRVAQGTRQQPRRQQERDDSRSEPTFGTMGKFLGY